MLVYHRVISTSATGLYKIQWGISNVKESKVGHPLVIKVTAGRWKIPERKDVYSWEIDDKPTGFNVGKFLVLQQQIFWWVLNPRSSKANKYFYPLVNIQKTMENNF